MKYLILIFFLTLFSSCTSAKSGPKIDNINTSCTQDADCVLVSTGCCSCNNGGTYLAIHKSEKDSYESELKKRCSVPQICKTWYRCGEWLDKAQCINSKCSVVDKK